MSGDSLPIEIAAGIGQSHNQRQVIVLTWDGVFTHIITWGRELEDSDQASLGGAKVQAFLGWADQPQPIPSRVQALQRDRDICVDALQALKSVRPSNWDDEEDHDQATAWAMADSVLAQVTGTAS